MTAHIIAKNVGVEFPIFNSSHRSLKKSILNVSTGGRVAQDSKNHVVVRALDDINLDEITENEDFTDHFESTKDFEASGFKHIKD